MYLIILKARYAHYCVNKYADFLTLSLIIQMHLLSNNFYEKPINKKGS